ncbi:unnamed protein product, partial [Amoebophrya sp. A25]|eukprot:GSA25T00003882001.1
MTSLSPNKTKKMKRLREIFLVSAATLVDFGWSLKSSFFGSAPDSGLRRTAQGRPVVQGRGPQGQGQGWGGWSGQPDPRLQSSAPSPAFVAAAPPQRNMLAQTTGAPSARGAASQDSSSPSSTGRSSASDAEGACCQPLCEATQC